MTRTVGLLLASAVSLMGIGVAAPAHADDDVLRLQTESGSLWCIVSSQSGGSDADGAECQLQFDPGTLAPDFSNIVGTNGDGTLYWRGANFSAFATYTPMPYDQTIAWGNWSIYPDASGTRFTNTRTGHGMFVSKENIYAF